jgi:NADH dehydrogenase
MIEKNYRKTVAIFGGTGFIGEEIVQHLSKNSYRIKIATRNVYLAQNLKVYGDIAQIELHQVNLKSEESIKRFLQDCDVCINLVGILFETRLQKFNELHASFPKKVASIFSKSSRSNLMIHFSALGANSNSNSAYIKSKFLGEEEVKSNFANSTIIRPSIVVGPKDSFFNMFAKLAGLLPLIPLVGSGVKFQPVYVGDVAKAINEIIINNISKETYELGGKSIYTFKELIELLLKEIRKKRIIFPIPFFAGRIQAMLFQLMPKPLLTLDQIPTIQL